MPIAKLPNVDLYYEVHGSGDPLVLVCGITIDHRFWVGQVRELSKDFQVIVFDNRDVGQTTCLPRGAPLRKPPGCRSGRPSAAAPYPGMASG